MSLEVQPPVADNVVLCLKYSVLTTLDVKTCLRVTEVISSQLPRRYLSYLVRSLCRLTLGWQKPYSVQHSASLPLSGPGQPPAWSMSAGSALGRRCGLGLKKKKRRKQVLSAPEGRGRTGAPSCASSKTSCLGLVRQEESQALQQLCEIEERGFKRVRVVPSVARLSDCGCIQIHQSILCDRGVKKGHTSEYPHSVDSQPSP